MAAPTSANTPKITNYGCSISLANTQEAFAHMLVGMVKDAGTGLLFYRFSPPAEL